MVCSHSTALNTNACDNRCGQNEEAGENSKQFALQSL